jgi:hypothetical protein
MSGILAALAGIKTAIATAVDEYFNRTTLLLNTSSTNGAQNNTFLDSSTNNFTITRNGNTTQGTFTPFSQTGWSNYFGSSNSLSVASNAAFAYGTGAITIEFWEWSTTAPTSAVEAWVTNGNNNLNIQRSSGGFYNVYDGTDRVSTTTVVSNQWNHIAFVRQSGGQTNLYVNGTSVLSWTSSVNYGNDTFVIAGSGAFPFPGYISNLRVVKGTAVYTSSFTPSTTPLTAITNTSLLTCQSNRFVDNSASPLTLTVSGTPSVQAFSPFAPTAAYDAAVVGGSGYFDGTGDYLNSTITAVSDFTVECWAYFTTAASKTILTIGDGSATSGFELYTNSASYIVMGNATGSVSTNPTTLKPNQWYHFAATRSGSTITAYVNGVSIGTANMGSTTLATTIRVGVEFYSSTLAQYFTGYIGSLRVSSTVRTGLTTLPTAPYTSDANTVYLLNYTNSGIYDSTAKNVLETVGNAQVSTTQAKWGTTSMYFDGTGDSLKGKLNNAIGGGDYTIEGWLYTGASGARYIFDMRETSQYLGAFTVGTTLYVNIGTTLDISATTSYPQNTWVHFAMVRSGSATNNTSVFLGGSRITQVTDTTNYSIIPTLYVGNDNTGAYSWSGYIDDFRITKGYARYSGSTYTVPAAAFPLQ